MTTDFCAIKNIAEVFNPKFDQYGDWENATDEIGLLQGGPAPTGDRRDGPFHSFEVVESKGVPSAHMSYAAFYIIRNAMAKLTNQKNEEGTHFTWEEPFGSILGRNDCYGWIPAQYVVKCSNDFKQYPSIDQAILELHEDAKKWANILYVDLAELFHFCANNGYGIKLS